MPDYFLEPKRRVARAKEHIQDFDRFLKTFLNMNPWARVVETDPQTGNETHKIKVTNPIPDDIASRAIEIGEGLRAALDGAGFAAASALGNTRLKGTYFPIADTDTQLDTDVIGRGRCKDLHPDILALFRTFNPYEDGNYLIWGVNQVANGTKHRILLPVGVDTSGSGYIKNFTCPGMCIRMAFPPRWDTEKEEVEICVVGPNSGVHYDMAIGILVALRPLGRLVRTPATDVFSAMASEVERVVLATEAECARILAQP